MINDGKPETTENVSASAKKGMMRKRKKKIIRGRKSVTRRGGNGRKVGTVK